jgi:uncharacterized protein
MNKTRSIFLAILVMGSIIFSCDAMATPEQKLPIEATAEIGGKTFELEVAKTAQQQQIGLMYRKTIPSQQGMLFVFEPSRYVRFWMKNVILPLDMIFLREGKIKAVLVNVPPCSTESCPTYGPATEVDQVIELRGGEAAKLNLQINNPVVIKYLKRQL